MLFFAKKMLTSAKIKRALVLKVTCSETKYVCVYLGAKFQDPSIILTSFRQAVILHPPPSHLKTDLLKSPPRLGLNGYTITHPNLCVLIKILLAVSQFTGPLGKSFSKLAKICFR